MNLFTPNISDLKSYYEKGRFLLAWRISMAFNIVFSFLAVIYSFSSAEALVPVSMVLVVTYSSTIYLWHTKNYKPLFWTYAISGTLLANFAMNYVLDFTHYVDFMWIVACVLVTFIGLGRKYGILFIILNCIGIAFFFWFTLNKHITILPQKNNLEILGDYVEVLFAFSVIAYLLYQFVAFQTYSELELTKANANLERQNRLILSKNTENETLVKEIHHRVKNNLQIIISLLRIQSSEMKNEEARNQFSEAINRIMAMSLIHQKLYREKELSKINLKTYIEELVNEIMAVSSNNVPVELNVETKIGNIGLKTIVPLGLLINELVSNSFKHAFTGKKSGVIKIKIIETNAGYEFVYSDDGSWSEPANSESGFGLELIQILTDQLEGTVMKNHDRGTEYEFKLKNLDLST